MGRGKGLGLKKRRRKKKKVVLGGNTTSFIASHFERKNFSV